VPSASNSVSAAAAGGTVASPSFPGGSWGGGSAAGVAAGGAAAPPRFLCAIGYPGPAEPMNQNSKKFFVFLTIFLLRAGQSRFRGD
jgi:hypothetical protein